MTENRAMLLTAAIAAVIALGLGARYRDLPKQDWPWWAAASTAAASTAAATCISRYAEQKRVGK